MTAYNRGDRVRYTGAGVWSESKNAIGCEGVVTSADISTAVVKWDEEDRTKAPPTGVFTDNLELVPASTLTCRICDEPNHDVTVDVVRKPNHYTSHPSGVECIDIVKHMNFALGNVVKYVWRADLKGNALEDLRKARQYLDIEIERREAAVV